MNITYRVIGRVNECPFVLGFRATKDMKEWIEKGWNEKQISFVALGSRLEDKANDEPRLDEMDTCKYYGELSDINNPFCSNHE